MTTLLPDPSGSTARWNAFELAGVLRVGRQKPVMPNCQPVSLGEHRLCLRRHCHDLPTDIADEDRLGETFETLRNQLDLVAFERELQIHRIAEGEREQIEGLLLFARHFALRRIAYDAGTDDQVLVLADVDELAIAHPVVRDPCAEIR